jgi:hypothetical protein
METSVSVEIGTANGLQCYAIKIGTPVFEVNVWVPVGEAVRLKEVRKTPWGSGALGIGRSAGSPAWWCVGDEGEEKETLSILVGQDDQTWDIALRFPLETIDAVIQEVEACSHP